MANSVNKIDATHAAFRISRVTLMLFLRVCITLPYIQTSRIDGIVKMTTAFQAKKNLFNAGISYRTAHWRTSVFFCRK